MKSPKNTEVYTIGHSNHPIDEFAELLKNSKIETLVDVRSTPASRFHPQFNKKNLEQSLASVGIEYVFLGDELGARSKDDSCYLNGRLQYRRLAATPLFRSGLEKLTALANKSRVAIMCAEKEPLECHRTILVGRELVELGVGVKHILSDGSLEAHEELLDRMVQGHGLSGDMFLSRTEAIDEAYSRTEAKVAYVRK